ncbi:MAG TPA: hypothetical protein VFJ74_11800 [Gemmatimonadaceae bacterium]|nr:hypothetical protein [Gemmatimonadaceae bacterium]
MKTRERDATRAAWTEAAGASAAGGALTRDTSSTIAGGAVKSPALDPDAEPRGSLWRYARFKIKDFVRDRALGYLGLGLAGLWVFRANYNPDWLPRTHSPFTEPEFFRQTLATLMGPLTFIGSLIASFGIVARDREGGFQRFLFSKPVSVTRYYLQSFGINALGFLGATALLLIATGVAFGRTVPFAGEMLYAAGMFSIVGGLTFLLSTLVRFDFGLATLLSLLSLPIAAIVRGARFGPFWRVAAMLLPPFDALSQVHQGLAQGTSALPALVEPVVYGAACVIAGLAIIRRRSIAN